MCFNDWALQNNITSCMVWKKGLYSMQPLSLLLIFKLNKNQKMHTTKFVRKRYYAMHRIGLFWDAFYLCFKTRPCAQPSIRNELTALKTKLISMYSKRFCTSFSSIGIKCNSEMAFCFKSSICSSNVACTHLADRKETSIKNVTSGKLDKKVLSTVQKGSLIGLLVLEFCKQPLLHARQQCKHPVNVCF